MRGGRRVLPNYLPWQPALEQEFWLVAHLTDATMAGLVYFIAFPPSLWVD